MIVQSLSVDSGNRCKRKLAIIGFGHPVHFCYDFVFVHTRTKYFHSRNVHISRHITCLFYLFYFFGRLITALCHNCTNKWNRTFLACRRNAQPLHQFQFMLRPVGRQVMHCLSLAHCFMQIVHDFGRRHYFRYAHTPAFLFQGRLRSHPYDMVNRKFIAKYNLLVLINIDNRRQTGKRQTEIIQEGRILTITESIVLIMQSLFVITQKQQHS